MKQEETIESWHDFRNILSGILGNISLAREMCPPDLPLHGHLESTERIAHSALTMATRVLSENLENHTGETSFHLMELIGEATALLFRKQSGSLAVRNETNWEPMIKLPRTRFLRAMFNLLSNARDAAGPEGKIEIVLHSCPDSRSLRLSIEDSGSGLDGATQEEIFSPGFTTKEGGTGLGLYSVQRFLKDHSCQIEVGNSSLGGAAFSLIIPFSHVEGFGYGEQSASSLPSLDEPIGKEILLLEDQVVVQQVLVDMLKVLGYGTRCTADPAEAIRCYREALESHRPFCAVIIDRNLPDGVDGLEVLKRLKVLNPNVAAILCSGVAGASAMRNPGRHGLHAALPKPCKLEDLRQVLESIELPGKGER